MHIRSVLCLALIHTLVDGYAQVITPVWPRLQKEFGLDPWELTLLLATWQLAASLSQPFFGYWGDRFGSRRLIALGPALAVICMSLIGLAPGPGGLVLLLIVGGLGIGAFHPEAAVGVAEASGTHAANGLAVFTFGGMVGLGLGPLVSGTLTEWYGLSSLAWTLPPGLLLLGALLFLWEPEHSRSQKVTGSASLTEILERRWLAVFLLLVVATLRVVPVLGVPLGLAFLLDQLGKSTAEIGWLQSVFLLSGGVGTLVCPLLARPGRELVALVATILTAAGCLVLLTWDELWARYMGLISSGLLLQGAIPILIAYSHRLLPRGRRLASSLTLGASWGLGGILVAVMQAYFNAAGRPEAMIWAMVPITLAAALISCLLPRADVPVAGHAMLPGEAPA